MLAVAVVLLAMPGIDLAAGKPFVGNSHSNRLPTAVAQASSFRQLTLPSLPVQHVTRTCSEATHDGTVANCITVMVCDDTQQRNGIRSIDD